MSYTRDRDAHTRGVGAIAALDAGNVARRRYRDQRRRQTNRRDAVMAEYTYRPGGGIGNVEALGRVNLTNTKGVINIASSRGNVAGPVARPQPGVGTGGGASRPNTSLYGGAGTVLQSAAVIKKNVATAMVNKTKPGLVFGAQGCVRGNELACVKRPGMVVDPVPPIDDNGAGTVSLSPASSSGAVVSGGGGGGTWGAGGSVPSYPGAEDPVVPDIPDEDEVSSGPDLKTIALFGGAAVGIWYFFLRKKGAQP